MTGAVCVFDDAGLRPIPDVLPERFGRALDVARAAAERRPHRRDGALTSGSIAARQARGR